MNPALVMTSSWWLEAAPSAPWRLLADACAWPRWWRSIRHVGLVETPPDDACAHWGWRELSRSGLRLRAYPRASEPFRLLEWQLGGDMRATWTWVVAAARPSGCDITCRCEVRLASGVSRWSRRLMHLLLQRRHFARMRDCARDMAGVLGCRGARVSEWSGLLRS
jgi:hypothetical protein